MICTLKKLARSKKLALSILFLIMLASFMMSISIVYANNNLHNSDLVWADTLYGEMENKDDLYPYNNQLGEKRYSINSQYDVQDIVEGSAEVSSVSLDVLYGAKRSMVHYYGELPYMQTHTTDGDWLDNDLEGTPSIYDTSVDENHTEQPNFGASEDVYRTQYWGFWMSDDENIDGPEGSDVSGKVGSNKNFANRASVEKAINAGNKLQSVRIYANQVTRSQGFFDNLRYLIYNAQTTIGGWSVKIVGLITQAKNLDMDFIMKTLKLDSLSEMLTKTLIYDSDTASLSPFAAICIIMLIFAIASFAFKWVKGQDKTTSLWEIFGAMLIGFMIIGIGVSGRISTLGSAFSNLASKAMYVGANSLSVSNTDEKAFFVDIDDPEHENQVVQLSEMALVNKTYIDMQICSQFGVGDIDDLKFSEFGSTAESNAKDYLSGIDSLNLEQNFNNNLGYYYWFANSPVKVKTDNNKEYPSSISATAAEDKLGSMMTFLQVQTNYLNSKGQSTDRIRSIVDHFAEPTWAQGFIKMLLFTAVMVALILVTLKYAVNVLLAKLEMFVGLIAIPISGPLILSRNKKLVDTGKAILGVLLISFLEMTVYSVMYDLILFATSVVLGPSIQECIVTLALLLLLFRLNPVIQLKLKSILERTARKISPSFVGLRASVKNQANRIHNTAMNKAGRLEKNVYDDDGNVIGKKKIIPASVLTAMTAAGNALTSDNISDRHGYHKIFTKRHKEDKKNAEEISKNEDKNLANSLSELTNATLNDVDLENLSDADKEKLDKKTKKLVDEVSAISVALDDAIDDIEEKNINGQVVGLNKDALTTEEAAQQDYIDSLNSQKKDVLNKLDALNDNPEYKALLQQKDYVEEHNQMNPDDPIEMSEEDKIKLEEFEKSEEELTNKAERINNELDTKLEELVTSVESRLKEEKIHTEKFIIDGTEIENFGEYYDKADGNTTDEKIKNAALLVYQNMHKDEIKAKLERQLEKQKGKEKKKRIGKIGSEQYTASTVEVETQLALELQIKRLDAGVAVGTKQEAIKEVQPLVKTTVAALNDKYAKAGRKMEINRSMDLARAELNEAIKSGDYERINAAKNKLDSLKNAEKELIESENAIIDSTRKLAAADANANHRLFNKAIFNGNANEIIESVMLHTTIDEHGNIKKAVSSEDQMFEEALNSVEEDEQTVAAIKENARMDKVISEHDTPEAEVVETPEAEVVETPKAKVVETPEVDVETMETEIKSNEEEVDKLTMEKARLEASKSTEIDEAKSNEIDSEVAKLDAEIQKKTAEIQQKTEQLKKEKERIANESVVDTGEVEADDSVMAKGPEVVEKHVTATATAPKPTSNDTTVTEEVIVEETVVEEAPTNEAPKQTIKSTTKPAPAPKQTDKSTSEPAPAPKQTDKSTSEPAPAPKQNTNSKPISKPAPSAQPTSKPTNNQASKPLDNVAPVVEEQPVQQQSTKQADTHRVSKMNPVGRAKQTIKLSTSSVDAHEALRRSIEAKEKAEAQRSQVMQDIREAHTKQERKEKEKELKRVTKEVAKHTRDVESFSSMANTANKVENVKNKFSRNKPQSTTTTQKPTTRSTQTTQQVDSSQPARQPIQTGRPQNNQHINNQSTQQTVQQHTQQAAPQQPVQQPVQTETTQQNVQQQTVQQAAPQQPVQQPVQTETTQQTAQQQNVQQQTVQPTAPQQPVQTEYVQQAAPQQNVQQQTAPQQNVQPQNVQQPTQQAAPQPQNVQQPTQQPVQQQTVQQQPVQQPTASQPDIPHVSKSEVEIAKQAAIEQERASKERDTQKSLEDVITDTESKFEETAADQNADKSVMTEEDWNAEDEILKNIMEREAKLMSDTDDNK